MVCMTTFTEYYWSWYGKELSISDYVRILADKELVEERKKLYEAIGYSENAKLATYSAEVCMQLIHDYYW